MSIRGEVLCRKLAPAAWSVTTPVASAKSMHFQTVLLSQPLHRQSQYLQTLLAEFKR